MRKRTAKPDLAAHLAQDQNAAESRMRVTIP
jgi:hypothetical protein